MSPSWRRALDARRSWPLSATELERDLREQAEAEQIGFDRYPPAPAHEHGAVIWNEAALPILQASSDGAFAPEREETDG